MVLALLAPALLLVAALMYRAYVNERVAIADKLLATARAVAGLVDREFKESHAILKTLRASRSLADGDLDAFDGIARSAVAGEARWLVLADGRYQQLINTQFPPGQPLPPLAESPEFRAAMAAGQAYISNLHQDPGAGPAILYASLPFFEQGQLRYTLTLAIEPAALAVALELQRFAEPSGLVSIVDRESRVLARSRELAKFVGQQATGDLRARIHAQNEGVHDTVTLDGVPVITAFHRARDSGWVTIVSAPKAALFASAQKILWLGLALSAVLLATAGLLAAWILRGVTSGMDSLVASSEAIGRGEAVEFEPSGLSETDFVGSAMVRSAQHLRQTSEQLKTTLDRLNFSLSSLAIGDWQWSSDRQQVQLSSRAAAILGLHPAPRELTRAELRSVIHPDDLVAVRRASEIASRTGEDYRAEFRILHPELGPRWVAVSGRPLPDESGAPTALAGVAQDITDLKHAADVLRTQNEVLENKVAERTHRLSETVGELEAFSYSISHDMRAPLRAMHSYAQLLETEHAAELSPEARRYLERINANAARLELLVRDVLAYSRVAKEQLETKPVDLDRFVRELIQQMTEDAPGTPLVTVVGTLPPVLAHEAYLSQIFTNLIVNGLKFVQPGQVPRVEIFAKDNGEFVALFVRDHGIGIDPANFGRLFQIFGRLNPVNAYEGTGIGLAIVKKAVQRMGGDLGVDSEVGKGATFWFTLPRA